VRRRSAIELADRSQWEADHARQVSRLALLIFDQTRHLHGLGDREHEWLDYASLLHDVGNHISYEKHHRHSYYLIKNGDLRGFEPAEIEVIALIARYHRRATPKKDHDGYADLSPELRRTVRLLAAILRLAETLDRSRHGVIGAITIRDRGTDLRMQVEAIGDAELEMWASTRQLAVLEKELGRPISLAKVQRDAPAGTAPKGRAPARRTQPPKPGVRRAAARNADLTP
jgi:exopolyphosphatase/guanosine-5'-triphosphate,3'-diphosphate pyrophosphatase